MGCPYNAYLRFGFKLTKSEAKSIEKKIEKIEKEFPEDGDWQKEVGDFDACIRTDENDTKFYLELSTISSVSNCALLDEVKENKIGIAKKEACKIYDESPFLKANFKKDDIKLLLICQYVG